MSWSDSCGLCRWTCCLWWAWNPIWIMKMVFVLGYCRETRAAVVLCGQLACYWSYYLEMISVRPSWSVRMKTEREKSVISSNFQDGKKWIRPCFVVAFFCDVRTTRHCLFLYYKCFKIKVRLLLYLYGDIFWSFVRLFKCTWYRYYICNELLIFTPAKQKQQLQNLTEMKKPLPASLIFITSS